MPTSVRRAVVPTAAPTPDDPRSKTNAAPSRGLAPARLTHADRILHHASGGTNPSPHGLRVPPSLDMAAPPSPEPRPARPSIATVRQRRCHAGRLYYRGATAFPSQSARLGCRCGGRCLGPADGTHTPEWKEKNRVTFPEVFGLGNVHAVEFEATKPNNNRSFVSVPAAVVPLLFRVQESVPG